MSRTAPPSLVVSHLSIKDFTLFDELAKTRRTAPQGAEQGIRAFVCTAETGPLLYNCAGFFNTSVTFRSFQRVLAAQVRLAGNARSNAHDAHAFRCSVAPDV
jgi:hypothetical protein